MSAERDAAVEAVLAAHADCTWTAQDTAAILAGSTRLNRVVWTCGMVAERYEHHLTAALAPLLDERARAAKTEALIEAANEWPEDGLTRAEAQRFLNDAAASYADQPGRDDAGGGGA